MKTELILPKTKLVFFDTPKEGLKGTLRGLFAILLIVILSGLWYGLLLRKFYKRYTDDVKTSHIVIGCIMITFFLSSALCVQLSKSNSEALLYGALVGLTLFACMNAVLLISLKSWDFKISLIDTLFGVVMSMVVSWIVYSSKII